MKVLIKTRQDLEKYFHCSEQQAKNMLRMRLGLFTKQEMAEMRDELEDELEECLRVIQEREAKQRLKFNVMILTKYE